MMATEKRLIDSDDVKKVLDNLQNETFALEDPKTAGVIAGTVITCGILIDEIPTVDAVEVVHGRWVHVPSSDMMTGKAYKCSECNKMRYGSFMPNYCSNCGAKMDL